MLALLRNPDYCVYATSSARTADLERAESAFNEASMEERMKFQEETLSNVNARKKARTRRAPRGAHAESAPRQLPRARTDSVPRLLYGSGRHASRLRCAHWGCAARPTP